MIRRLKADAAKKLVALAVLAYLCASGLAAQTDEPLQPPRFIGERTGYYGYKRGVDLPAFSFSDSRRAQLDIAAFNGKVVLVNLWATWCPPCVKEMPSLSSLQARFEATNFQVVAVCNACGSAEEIQAFFDEHGIENLDIFFHPSYDVLTDLNVKGLPTSVLVDRDGKELGRLLGDADWDSTEARALIEYYLSVL